MDGFFFRRLRAYQLSKRLVRFLYDETRRVPIDTRTIVWHLLRAASSVALNIAEGCGEYRAAEKARFFRMARRSSWETVAALEMLVSLGALDKATLRRAEAGYTEVGSMLTAMAKRQEAMRRSGTNRPAADRRETKDASHNNESRRPADEATRQVTTTGARRAGAPDSTLATRQATPSHSSSSSS